MPTTQLDVRLTEVYGASQRRLARRGGVILAAAFLNLRSWDAEDVQRLSTQAGTALNAVQTAGITLTATFLSQLLSEPVSVAPVAFTPQWRAPFLSFWKHLADGDDFDTALKAGENRASAAGLDAVVRASDEFTKSAVNVVGWRRVPQGATCEWCRRISTQLYKTQDSGLRARHSRCDCSVIPAIGDKDPGRVINNR